MPTRDALLSAMLHGQTDAAIATDARNLVRVWNEGAARLIGVDEKDALGRTLEELLGHELRHGTLRTPAGRHVTVDVDIVGIDSPDDGDGVRHVWIVREAERSAASLLARFDVGNALSPRLQETLAGLVEGLSEKELAARMNLSPHTVHDYVKSLYRRLGVQSRAELVAQVLRATITAERSP